MRNALNPVQELLVLYEQRRFAEMEQHGRKLLKQGAAAPLLDELVGMALTGQGRFNEALSFLQKAVHAIPNDAQFLENLALCQRHLKQFAEAEQALRKSLAVRPNSVEALNALGSVLRSLKRFDQAREAFEQALALAPDHAASLVNLAKMLVEQGQAAAAEPCLRRAIAANPTAALFHEELALVLGKLGNLSEAETCLRRAIELDPRSPRSYAFLASLLVEQFRRQEAGICADAALERIGEITPAAAAANIGLLDVIASALSEIGRYGTAAKIFKATCAVEMTPARAMAAFFPMRCACDWEFAANVETELVQSVHNDASIPWSATRLLLMPTATPGDQFAAMRKLASGYVMAADAAPAVMRGPATGRRTGDRIRVGYFSSDFRDHVISHLIAGVMDAHDKSRFEIIAYDFSPPANDPYRKRLEAAFDRWVLLGKLSTGDTARHIADGKTDILVDLMGWTSGHRAPVLALRPAPLQLYWLGAAGTTGAPWIDYNIADRIVIPPHNEPYYSEKIIRLPDSYLPTDIEKPVSRTLTRQDYGLPEDGIVFCSFNTAFKFTAEVFDIWLRLLRDVPHSVLWLTEPVPEAIAALRTRAVAQGVAAERIIFAPRTPDLAGHLARVAQADIALDCFPYGSHTTASDMLLVGVPLIALTGETFASRVSASVLSAANMPELITGSYDDYYALALRLATDRSALDRMKARTRDCRAHSPLFDTARFTRNLEAAYQAIWERHLSGSAPATLDFADGKPVFSEPA